MDNHGLLELLKQGGVTLVILIGCSVLALVVAFERIIALWGARSNTKSLAQAISNHLLRGEVDAARAAAERSTVVTAEVFRVGFQRASARAPVAAAVERERVQTTLRLKNRLWLLGTIAAITPFVGLFGTVAGVMKSFRDLGLDVSGGGSGGSAAVMAGISEALVATAAGILIAVVAMALYNYFQARLARLAVELKLLSEEFCELLNERASDTARPAGN